MMKEYKARVKFEGKEWLVIDTFRLDEKKYMYLISDLNVDLKDEKDLDAHKNDIEILFITNTSGNSYKRVTDSEILNRLNMEVTKRALI